MGITRRAAFQSGFAAATLNAFGRGAFAAVQSKAEPLKLGVCYYPEHWSPDHWKQDATDMVARGISRVRIGEFAWTLMEPEPGRYEWAWLDRAVDTLSAARLGVVLGTPTASPPEWMVARYPEILPVAKDGRTKSFGSRRYYSFSSIFYREEATRIATAMAERYGRHPGVVGWQIDNEYGCHDTTYSYGPADLAAFRLWLRARYGSIDRLNEAWGTVVWSQQLPSFEAVNLPMSSPYDFPPDMLLDYRRFSSAQVLAFHKAQAAAIRPLSPGRFVTTNFMANFTEFDHFPVGADTDFASWDSYPLGVAAGGDDARWDRTGNPDLTGWNHDLIRGLSSRPFWVMEQQPGAVNWARYNPAPLPGMVRLWAWEAFAHGAGAVSWFRWRQGQVGPEQMHAGLNLPDGQISPGGIEAAKVAKEIVRLGPVPPCERADVALLFDYESTWMSEIQPNGIGGSDLAHAQSWYAALRGLGMDVDVLRPGSRIDGYRLIVIPTLWTFDDRTLQALKAAAGLVLIGPRSGSKTQNFSIPSNLPPGPLQDLIPMKVTQVASLRRGTTVPVQGGQIAGNAIEWREWIDTKLPSLANYADGLPAVIDGGHVRYVGCKGDATLNAAIMRAAVLKAGLQPVSLPDGVRLRRRGPYRFAFNYGGTPYQLPDKANARFVVGGPAIGPQDCAIWTER